MKTYGPFAIERENCRKKKKSYLTYKINSQDLEKYFSYVSIDKYHNI